MLYCVSFFEPIAYQVVLGEASNRENETTVTAASYLDAAMAQITVRGHYNPSDCRSDKMCEFTQSIYPLTVFLLVGLDKFHHSREPQILHNEWSKARVSAVNVALEVNVERSTALSSPSAYPMTTSLSYTDGSATVTVCDTKPPGSETA